MKSFYVVTILTFESVDKILKCDQLTIIHRSGGE